jgi:hypothetical protein
MESKDDEYYGYVNYIGRGSSHYLMGIDPYYENSRKIQIPETLKKMILKSNPEIKDIVDVSYDVRNFVSISPESPYTPAKKYLVNISLKVTRPTMDSKGYQEKINTFFSLAYPELNGDVKIFVTKLICVPEKTTEESFLNIFGY